MRIAVLLCVLIACAAAKPLTVGPWVHEGPSPTHEVVPVSVGLKIRNEEWLTRFVTEVSNPRHPNWRAFTTKEALRQKLAPAPAVVRAVLDILEAAGAQKTDVYPSGDFIMTHWTVADANRAFGVELQRFRHASTGQLIHRARTAYVLPASLAGAVDVIGMITEFPEGHFKTRNMARPAGMTRASPAPRDSTCNSVMNWGYPASSDTDLYAQVQIVCCNGQPTTSLTAPCTENGGVPLTGFTMMVSSNKTGRPVSRSSVAYTDVAAQCFQDGESITCPLAFTSKDQVQPFQLFNLDVVGEFGTPGMLQEGQSSTFPVALVTSPFVTPQSFAEYYQVPAHWAATHPAGNNSQSVVEFGGQYYSPSDLSAFLGNMSLPATTATVVGPNDAARPGDEATLDIEWIMAVGIEVDTVFWSVGTGYLLEWAQQLLSASNTPLVNSVSYGGNEVNSPVSYRNRVDSEFQKLAAIGVSIVVSSGDAGATNVGHGSESCDALLPQYPAASPFVTSVSATFFTPSDIPMCSISYYGKPVHCSDVHVGEVAVSADDGMDWTTGGGFSSSVPRPSWQNTAVTNYLSQHGDLLPPASLFNATNRGYPDVSATGHNLMLILRDAMDIGDGTSASSPIFTGILALLNQYLLSIGEAPLGFANPLLYMVAQETPSAFYDVTMGGNACGDVLHSPYIACCPYGYKSATGWDPVTGLGTPRFASLFSAVKRLVAQQQLHQN